MRGGGRGEEMAGSGRWVDSHGRSKFRASPDPGAIAGDKKAKKQQEYESSPLGSRVFVETPPFPQTH